MFDRFLQHLHRGGQWAYFHALPQRRSLWYSTTDTLELDPAHAKTNLYFSVHPCTAIPPTNAHGEIKEPAFVRAQLGYIAAINCLYAEYDAKTYGNKEGILAHVDALPVPAPSAVVDSGRGYHCYWLLKDSYRLETDETRSVARLIQDRWVELVGGDPGVKDLTRILRVPGSRNFKYDPPPVVQWVRCDLSLVYPLQTLTTCLPPVKIQTVERVKEVATARSIEAFNQATDVAALLSRHGYTAHGRYRMVSPWSGSKRDGVTVDTDKNRAFVHTGGDPLCDGYWKRPFDVVCILDHGGDFRRALAAIRGE